MPNEAMPEATDAPLVMNVTLRIKPEHRAAYRAELDEVLPRARAEAACEYLVVGEVAAEPGTFVLSERWRNADEYVTTILQQPYFQRYLERTEPWYAEPRTVLVLEPVTPPAATGSS